MYFLLLQALIFLVFAAENAGLLLAENPAPVHPSNISLLVYPEGGAEGSAALRPVQNPAHNARKYETTPLPENVHKISRITSVFKANEKTRTLLVQGSKPVELDAEKPTSTLAQSAVKTAAAMPQENSVDPVHPPVRTAAFQGVIPGETTSEGVRKLWGEPLKTSTLNAQPVHLYSTDVLNHIEVIYRENTVRSIVVRLDEPFPEEQVREVLKAELLKSKPVLIPDEKGEIIGEVFPEKGVLFLFASAKGKNNLLVQQIGIEMVTSEPFVLRAEATLNDQPTEALRDLQDAIRINNDDAKAFWLLAQVELMDGDTEAALIHSEHAIRLDEKRPAYHLTYVQALVRMNRIEEAKLYLEETLGICDKFPHEKAKALTLLGDLYRTSLKQDYEIAIECHSEAIHVASLLVEHENPTIRQTAKDVLLEAHLGAAKDVAWGKWEKKEEAISKWISRAREIVRDPEMKVAKRFSKEYAFKIAVCALAAQVGVTNQTVNEACIQDVIETGNALIQGTNDPILIQKYQWEMSLSLYDAVQIFQLRKKYKEALKYGEMAASYMEKGIKGRKSETDLYLLGRLYFRLGAIHAIGNQNHRAAIEWFDLAKPVFEKLLPRINHEALGRMGETLVSMGVSYWYTDQMNEAIRLTERGLKQIERAVRNKTATQQALSIPYTNLAKMYGELGQTEAANRYSQLATATRTIK